MLNEGYSLNGTFVQEIVSSENLTRVVSISVRSTTCSNNSIVQWFTISLKSALITRDYAQKVIVCF